VYVVASTCIGDNSVCDLDDVNACGGALCRPISNFLFPAVPYVDPLDPFFRATSVSVSGDAIAAVFSEALAGVDLNEDEDTLDELAAYHRLGAPPGTWLFPQASPAIATLAAKVSGAIMGFLRSPDRHFFLTGLPLPGDTELLTIDTGLAAQEFELGPFDLVCTNQTGAVCDTDADCGQDELCTAGGQCMTVDFEMGCTADEQCPGADPQCRIDMIAAFSASEALNDGQNLNGDADAVDDVMHVYDLLTGRLINTEQAVTPCPEQVCNPDRAFTVTGSEVRFFTREAEQGEDLDNNGILELVVQTFNPRARRVPDTGACMSDSACTADEVCVESEGTCLPVNILSVVDENLAGPEGNAISSTSDPLKVVTTSTGATGAVTTTTGRCIQTVGDPNPDTGRCPLDQFLDPADGQCKRDQGACVDGACTQTGGSSVVCAPVRATTGGTDTDGDGVLDSVDNCRTLFNPAQRDADGDTVGDRCDAAQCGNGTRESGELCDDGIDNGPNMRCSRQCLVLCDINADDSIDQTDIDRIFVRIGQPRNPNGDPANLDGDPVISIFDARGCVNRCDNPGCEPDPEPVVSTSGSCGLLGIEALLGLAPWLAVRRRRRARIASEETRS
jgi:hypothetical protein